MALSKLSNENKAKLLHALLPVEIPSFIRSIERTAIDIDKNRESIKQKWNNKTITADTLFPLALWTRINIGLLGNKLHHDSNLFARELFTGPVGEFVLYCMQEYINTCTSESFTDGVKFLFGLKPIKNIPNPEN